MSDVSVRPPRFTISNAITAGLTAIERARGFLEAATLSEEYIEFLEKNHVPYGPRYVFE